MRSWARNTIAFVVTFVAMVAAYWFFVMVPMQERPRAEAAAAGEASTTPPAEPPN